MTFPLPRGTIGWSVICDYGFPLPHSLAVLSPGTFGNLPQASIRESPPQFEN